MKNDITDIQLITNLQQGDKNALYTLYDRYSAAIYGVIIRMCKKEDVAQDILQESFIKIWKSINQYNSDKGRFYTWAYRIAKNTTLNELRKSKSLIQTEDLSVYTEKETEEANETYPEINGMIKTLDSHHQEAIELVYFKGYTHRQAHKEMGIPLGTFKSYIRQALSKLRENYPTELLLFMIFMETMGNG